MSVQASDLLFTKLHRPPVTGDQIVRPRLIEMLDRGLSGPLSLVSAAAGFGKTTLVSSWIESRGGVTPPLPSTWLSLDHDDSDLVVFLRYFVAAIRAVFPESCAGTFALLEAPQSTSPTPLVVALSNDIERLPARLVLVLDDYHAIRGEAVHDFLSELIRHWPQRLHLVLISRSSPPLPLVSLRARGLITEIRGRDLRFTPEETAAYVGRALPKPLEERAVVMLQERTEGWIAGLRLAILSWRGTDDADRVLPDLTSSGSGITDYLADEVLAHQPPAIRSFLLKTSVLNHFCAELCEAVVGSEVFGFDMRACMDWLERADLFFIPLDNRRQWYRYHHLWRELLAQRSLADLGSVQVSALHRRAALWFADQGLVDEALRHALAADDLDLAARLMEQHLRDALNRADRSTLERWERLLPEDFVARRPWLLVMKGFAAAIAWQADRVGTLCRQAEAFIGDEGEADLPADELKLLRGNIAMLRGLEAYACNQHVQAIAHARDALAILPREWVYARGAAKLFLGMSMQSIGQGGAVERLFLDEYQAEVEKTDSHVLWLLFAVSFNALQDGRLAQARLTGEIMLQQATRGRFVTFQGWAHYLLGLAHYLWNDLAAAAQCFGKIAEQPYVFYTLTARDGLIGMVLTLQARGAHAAAWQTLADLSQFELDQLGFEHEETRALRAYLFMTQGDNENALRWADTLATTVPDRPLMSPLDPQMIRAQILLARGTPADVAVALDIVDTLYELVERTHNTRFRIALRALQALLFDAQGRSDAADAALQQAIDLAQPGGAIRSFVELGPAMHGLLNRLAQLGYAADAIHRILAAFPVPAQQIATGDAESRGVANAKYLSENSSASHPEPVEGRLAPAKSRTLRQAQDAQVGFRIGSQLNEQLVEPLIEPLTNRELDVLALLRERLSNKEIARALSLSPMTVKRHTANLYGKLGVNKRRDAVIKAEALKILPPR